MTTLPYPFLNKEESRVFGGVLKPRLFSVQKPSTSELLRTL